MKKFTITEELLTGIVNYLFSQPFKDVNLLIQAVQSEKHVAEYMEPVQPAAQPAAQPVEDF